MSRGESTPVILVHGGAGGWKADEYFLSRVRGVLSKALREGSKYLRDSALEAAVEAVKVLEDSGILNAGTGSVLDFRGGLSMDAGVMDGRTYRAGAVGNVSYPKNPVVLAKLVMERTDHVILTGGQADELAERLGLEKHPGPSERALRRFKELMSKFREDGLGGRFVRNLKLISEVWGDTVGAVALDSSGYLASAVSTGGIIFKLPGRVGDSAVPGAGFYANDYGAACATGIGETIILGFLTLNVVKLIEGGLKASEAVKEAIRRHTERFGKNTAGVIAVDREGGFGAYYNTTAMPWGYLRLGESPVIKGFPPRGGSPIF